MRCCSENIPIYPYFSVVTASENDGTLYHFTTVESAKKILRSMTLKLSDPRGFNDPSDCNLAELTLKSYRDHHKLWHTWNGIRVLCFGTNTDYPEIVQYGYDHPRMWAQYADNNRGVCFAIDKKSLIKDNSDLTENDFVKVKYSYCPDKYLTELGLTSDNICEYIEILACKNKDWEHENETRLINFNSLDFVSIENSVAFIILGPKMPKDDYRDIVSVLNDKNSKAYGKIGKDTLVKATYTYGSIAVKTIDVAVHSELPELKFEY